MRIKPEQTRLITQCVQRHLGDAARVWLFGSRLSDDKHGGDIDLYVEITGHPLMSEMRCKHALEDMLDAPIDLVVRAPDDASPIAIIAKTEGVAL